MISGIINDTRVWATCPKPIVQMMQILSDAHLQTAENGKYEVNEDMFYVVMEYEAQNLENVKFETHQKYIDIQVVLHGSESMGWAPLRKESVIDIPYASEQDVIYYKKPLEYTMISCYENYCCVFFPNDIHAPGIINQHSNDNIKDNIKNNTKVKKVVGKVSTSLVFQK